MVCPFTKIKKLRDKWSNKCQRHKKQIAKAKKKYDEACKKFCKYDYILYDMEKIK